MEGHRHVVLQVHRRDRPVARSIGAQNDESAGPARGRVLECQQPAVALGVAAGAKSGSQTVSPASAVYRLTAPER